jgi:hypothetical protein
MQNITLLLAAKAILEQMGFEIAILERKGELFWPEREGYFHLTPKHMYDSDCLMAWNDHQQLKLSSARQRLINGLTYTLQSELIGKSKNENYDHDYY